MTNKTFVTFTPDFIATKFPGYFFNTVNNKLYSMKMTGILKPLKFQYPNRFNHIGEHLIQLADGSKMYSKGAYSISVNGRHRYYNIERLMELPRVASVIPVAPAK